MMRGRHILLGALGVAAILYTILFFWLVTMTMTAAWCYLFTLLAFALQITGFNSILGTANARRAQHRTAEPIISLLYLAVQIAASFILALFGNVAAAVAIQFTILAVYVLCMLLMQNGLKHQAVVEQESTMRSAAMRKLEDNLNAVSIYYDDPQTRSTLQELLDELRYSDPYATKKVAAQEANMVTLSERLMHENMLLAQQQQLIGQLHKMLLDRNARLKADK